MQGATEAVLAFAESKTPLTQATSESSPANLHHPLTNSEISDMSDKQKHFQDILQSFDTAMLTTIGTDNKPRSRPMRIAKICDDDVLWFVTSVESGKVDEIEANNNAAIVMQGGGKYLSMTGTAHVVNSKERIDEVWKDAWKIWFPEGKNDPSVVLLKIEPEEGEYWDLSGTNRLRFMYEAGKAYFSGEEIDTSNMDSNAKVSLS